ncbi:MAG: hypothetical protein QGG40_13285, partial [Myxococcota bacterium]|nr:hypothetical protein [Myxococcota bacterium]
IEGGGTPPDETRAKGLHTDETHEALGSANAMPEPSATVAESNESPGQTDAVDPEQQNEIPVSLDVPDLNEVPESDASELAPEPVTLPESLNPTDQVSTAQANESVATDGTAPLSAEPSPVLPEAVGADVEATVVPVTGAVAAEPEVDDTPETRPRIRRGRKGRRRRARRGPGAGGRGSRAPAAKGAGTRIEGGGTPPDETRAKGLHTDETHEALRLEEGVPVRLGVEPGSAGLSVNTDPIGAVNGPSTTTVPVGLDLPERAGRVGNETVEGSVFVEDTEPRAPLLSNVGPAESADIHDPDVTPKNSEPVPQGGEVDAVEQMVAPVTAVPNAHLDSDEHSDNRPTVSRGRKQPRRRVSRVSQTQALRTGSVPREQGGGSDIGTDSVTPTVSVTPEVGGREGLLPEETDTVTVPTTDGTNESSAKIDPTQPPDSSRTTTGLDVSNQDEPPFDENGGPESFSVDLQSEGGRAPESFVPGEVGSSETGENIGRSEQKEPGVEPDSVKPSPRKARTVRRTRKIRRRRVRRAPARVTRRARATASDQVHSGEAVREPVDSATALPGVETHEALRLEEAVPTTLPIPVQQDEPSLMTDTVPTAAQSEGISTVNAPDPNESLALGGEVEEPTGASSGHLETKVSQPQEAQESEPVVSDHFVSHSPDSTPVLPGEAEVGTEEAVVPVTETGAPVPDVDESSERLTRARRGRRGQRRRVRRGPRAAATRARVKKPDTSRTGESTSETVDPSISTKPENGALEALRLEEALPATLLAPERSDDLSVTTNSVEPVVSSAAEAVVDAPDRSTVL